MLRCFINVNEQFFKLLMTWHTIMPNLAVVYTQDTVHIHSVRRVFFTLLLFIHKKVC